MSVGNSSGTHNGKKRSLILAGGGVKVAFQAGALQVWLDEAGLKFDHADGASGGVFNLAMMCQGMMGTEIADRWRSTDPKVGVSFNWREYAKLFYAESLFTLDSYRENIFPSWGLDWSRINASALEATFNVYNFSRHELEVIEPQRMTEDLLVACVSLPMWFPPQRIAGQTYIDSVFISDANLEEAIRRGADELWVIWTVSDRDEWHNGFVASYFQIIETSANGHFKRIVKRIEENNAALARGEAGEFGRHIELKILKADVPLHYLVNFSRDRLAEAVNLGVMRAREWCRDQNIELRAGSDDDREYPLEINQAQTSLRFTEEMKGFVTFGETDCELGFNEGRRSGTALMFRLTISVDDVDRFVVHPEHKASAEGYVECAQLGGRLPVERGVFNLFIDDRDPARKRMLYRLFFHDNPKDDGGESRPLTLSGHKNIFDDPGFDLWSDTTTLFTRLYRGHVEAAEEQNAGIIASGMITIHLLDFIKQLTTFRTECPTISDRVSAMNRFGRLFLGKLWDVYAREVLISGHV